MPDDIFIVYAENDVSRLVAEPETGMGYQLFRVGSDYFLVISTLLAIRFRTRAELFARLQGLDIFWRDAVSSQQHSGEMYRRHYSTPEWLPSGKLQVIPSSSYIIYNMLQTGPQRKASSTAIQLIYSVSNPKSPEMFFRFSANPHDPRVKLDGSFASGTYVTTFSDLRMVPSGLAAVGLYALPSPQSARYVYTITTASAHSKGTVAPLFGQAGGGVEVVFQSTAQPMPNQPHAIDIA